ncbi:MAG: stage II sporulation protein M [Lachnospiraceae bacterium]|nr:stage II sporulation protein M [Lachnospiraceae bacterium]
MPRFRIQIQIRERHKLMLLFLLGLVGCALFLRQTGAALEEEIASEGRSFLVGLTGQEDQGMLVHILWRRAWLPFLWIGASFTAAGLASLYLSWVYLGFAVGALLWTAMVFGGWRGPFYFWGLVFPHYLFYVPALLLLYIACLRWNQFWRQRRLSTKRIFLAGRQLRIFVVRLAFGLMLYLAGVWVEYNLNPWIFKKIFVKPQ